MVLITSIYWEYFFYIVRHKWEYFKIAMKRGRYISAFTHDLSKFLPSEFGPYARFFYARPVDTREVQQNGIDFDMAWLLHQHRNKHHWNYWVKSDGKAVQMPKRYVIQMVCDWEAMAAQKGTDDAVSFWQKNRYTMALHALTVIDVIKYIYK